MSQLLFPDLNGKTWNYSKSVVRNNIIQTSSSGIETRIQFWRYPKYLITINYEVLTDESFIDTGGLVAGDLETVFGFYNQVGGTLEDFLYRDPVDNTVENQAFAIGDGVTTQFQLIRTVGGFNEPVYGVGDSTLVFVNNELANTDALFTGTPQPIAGSKLSMLNPPANGTEVRFTDGTVAITTVGLVGGQHYFIINRTSTDFQVSLTHNGTPVIINHETGNVRLYTIVTGSDCTVSNISNFGVVTFTSPPPSNYRLTWSGGYYFRVRFVDNQLDTKGFLKSVWACDSINLTTVLLRGSA